MRLFVLLVFFEQDIFHRSWLACGCPFRFPEKIIVGQATMFFLLPILFFAALAVNTLAVPQMAWPLRARTESSPIRPRKEEFQLRRTESTQRNFSLPLHARADDRRGDRTPSPLSPRNFAFPLQAKDDSDVHISSTTSTGKVRPRDAFAIRPRIRPRKSDS